MKRSFQLTLVSLATAAGLVMTGTPALAAPGGSGTPDSHSGMQASKTHSQKTHAKKARSKAQKTTKAQHTKSGKVAAHKTASKGSHKTHKTPSAA